MTFYHWACCVVQKTETGNKVYIRKKVGTKGGKHYVYMYTCVRLMIYIREREGDLYMYVLGMSGCVINIGRDVASLVVCVVLLGIC